MREKTERLLLILKSRPDLIEMAAALVAIEVSRLADQKEANQKHE